MKTFQEIIAWQKAYQLTLLIYRTTASFPKSEEFALKSQVRRASVSIISNIAEGFKKITKRERVHFYKMAESSLEEVKCQTLLSRDLHYLTLEDYEKIQGKQDEAGRILRGWIKAQR